MTLNTKINVFQCINMSMHGVFCIPLREGAIAPLNLSLIQSLGILETHANRPERNDQVLYD